MIESFSGSVPDKHVHVSVRLQNSAIWNDVFKQTLYAFIHHRFQTTDYTTTEDVKESKEIKSNFGRLVVFMLRPRGFSCTTSARLVIVILKNKQTK